MIKRKEGIENTEDSPLENKFQDASKQVGTKELSKSAKPSKRVELKEKKIHNCKLSSHLCYNPKVCSKAPEIGKVL